MNKSEKNIFYLYVIFSFLFIAVTTNYLSLNDIIFIANQTDSLSYTLISKNAPLLSGEDSFILNNNTTLIQQHVAQRFVIPYIIGSMAHFLNVNFFLIFKLFTLIFIFFYIFLINILIKKLNFNLKVSTLFFSILFLNPYIIRYHIFQPVHAHDMLFFCFGLLFFLTMVNKNYFSNLLISIIAIYLRQTSIALLIGSSIFLLINKKIKLFLLLLLSSSLSLFLIIKTGQLITSDTFPINLAYGIVYYDFSQFEKLLKFLLLGIMPFAPLFVILFGKINKNIKISSAFILFFVCLMMIGQPILAGPDGSVNNVGRIANLCFPILTCFCFYVWNFEKFINKNYLFYTFISGMFLWSLHPTYSVFKFFGVFRFYDY